MSVKAIQVSCSREELAIKYAACIAANPLLSRIEGEAKAIGWTDEEIRTYQLLTAVQSNAGFGNSNLRLLGNSYGRLPYQGHGASSYHQCR